MGRAGGVFTRYKNQKRFIRDYANATGETGGQWKAKKEGNANLYGVAVVVTVGVASKAIQCRPGHLWDSGKRL